MHPEGLNSGGVCIQGGLHLGAVGQTQQAGSTHPTGMHSCQLYEWDICI